MAEDFLNYRVPKQVADIVVGAAQLDRALAAGTVQPAEPERINGTLRRRIAVRDLIQFGGITPETVANAEAVYARECHRSNAHPSRRKHGGPYCPRVQS
jgi:hypothetical protein